ncbi:hypothetical protein HN51_005377 [Arachis hypogaea]|nr:Protein LURP-one-related [Arachis hypogaea]
MSKSPTSSSSPPSATAIINHQYCVPHEVDLIITKQVTFGGDDNFTVTDINKNVVFTVMGPLATFVMPRKERFLRDARGNTVLRLRKAIGDDIWKAYRGESTEQRDLIFSRRQPPPFQLKANMGVFLANNTTQVCDFKILKQNSFGQSWLVCIGESDNVVAQITHEVFTWFSRKKFMVKVYPNIDYAFIVALTVTLEYHLSHSDLAKFSS